MTAEMNVIADIGCDVGEGPLWHPEEQILYWTDIPAGRLYRYDPASASHECFYDDETVGGFTFQRDGSLLLFMSEGTVKIWRDGETQPVVDGLPEEQGMRFNDVIADPRGRVFCGTMDDEDFSVGRLYRLDPDGTMTLVLDSVQLPNGMGFTPDRSGFYFAESSAKTIHLFDYDDGTGELSNRRTFAQLVGTDAMYDGLTVDAEGRVWSALWAGGAIVRHTAEGEIERRLSIPATNVTSLTFGGDERRDIYVTSAALEAPGRDEHPGALFHLESSVAGVDEFMSSVAI